jgi:hypothetical protein
MSNNSSKRAVRTVNGETAAQRNARIMGAVQSGPDAVNALPDADKIIVLKWVANGHADNIRTARVRQDKTRAKMAAQRDAQSTARAVRKTIVDELSTARLAARLDTQTVAAQSTAVRAIDDAVKRAHGRVDVAAGRLSVAEQRAAIARKTTQRDRAAVAVDVIGEKLADGRVALAADAHAVAVERAAIADTMAAVKALRTRIAK